MTVLAVRPSSTDVGYLMWCPACQDTVRITNLWGWNGSLDKPTFTPSILITGVQWNEGDHFYRPGHSKVPPGSKTICHSFLTDGVWQFLPDSTHDHAGQSLPMAELPEWLASES